MDEHDDDLESEVIEGAEKEEDRFPDTGDEFDDDTADETEQDEDLVVDEDPAEL